MSLAILVALVRGSQLFFGCAWLMVSHHYAGSAWRIVRGRGLWWDAAGCWAFALGIAQSGFTIKWLIFDADMIPLMSTASLTFWGLVYFVDGLVAIGILHTWQHREKDIPGAQARARAALAMWGGVLASSCVLMWAVQ